MDTSMRMLGTQGLSTPSGTRALLSPPAETVAQPADGVSVSSAPSETREAAPTRHQPTPEEIGRIGGEVGKCLADSLFPGPGLMHTKMLVIDGKGSLTGGFNAFYDAGSKTLNFPDLDSQSIAAHEVGHGVLDEPVRHTRIPILDYQPNIVGSFNWSDNYWRDNEGARPMVGGMLGSLLGTGSTLPVGLTERLREATDTMQRLQGLEDGYTQKHMARAGNLAMKMGAEMSLSPEQAFALAHAALVYDVGKLEVDEKLLNKPGKLTDEERAAVNKHVEPSEDLLSLFNPSPETRSIIRSHHERWDGKGFPDGLAGERIPLTARLISITDSWDALVSDRPFRGAMPYERARGIIESGAGTQYDPTLVKLFFDKVATRPG